MFTSPHHEQFQNWYNTAIIGLASQGFVRSVTDIGFGVNRCQYRGSNNTKCGIGYLIPDERYNSLTEGNSIFIHSVRNCVDPDRNWTYEEVEFLNDLQTCHDNGKIPSEMKTKLSALAIQYNLDIPKEICL